MNIDEAVAQIAQTGFLGALLLIAGFAIVKLYDKIEMERNSRLEDMKQVWCQDIQFKTELKNLLDRILRILEGGKK